jgi:hypothetical protein
MLFIAIAIWIVLLVFVVALCRVAARGDAIEEDFVPQLPVGSWEGIRSAANGLVVWDEDVPPLGQKGLAGTAAVQRHAATLRSRI